MADWDNALHVDVMTAANPFAAAEVLRGAARFAMTSKPIQFSTCIEGERASVLRQLQASRADALIVVCMSQDFADEVLLIGKPAVNLFRAKVHPKIPTVCVDEREVGRVAARHLVDQGFAALAYVGIEDDISAERAAGFAEEAAAHHCPCFVLSDGIVGSARMPEWEQAINPDYLQTWLKTLPQPLGVMTFNDQIGQAVIIACQRARLDVPDAVGVVGVDNTPLRCEFNRITLSSVDWSPSTLGYQAAALLDRLINGQPPPAEPVVLRSSSVVARRSTAAMVFTDPDVRTALRYIRQHAGDGITVNDVLKVVAVSRSSLERRFMTAIGRLPGEEIRRVRMSLATRLLRETAMPQVEIATACGFEYLSNFSAAFKASHGMTPKAYRQRNKLAGRGL